MTLPEPSNEMPPVQYDFYKTARRLSRLWYALTIVGLILWILCIILICVGTIFALTSDLPIFNSLLSTYFH